MLATWESHPDLTPRLPAIAGGPRLPACAAARPLALPASDILGSDGSAGELSREPTFDEGLAAEGCWGAEPAPKSFQSLLLDLATEHQRALAQLRAELLVGSAAGRPPGLEEGWGSGRRFLPQPGGPPLQALAEGPGAREAKAGAGASEGAEGGGGGEGGPEGAAAGAAPPAKEASTPRASSETSGSSGGRSCELEAVWGALEPAGCGTAAAEAEEAARRFSKASSVSDARARRFRWRCTVREVVWRFLDDPESSKAAHRYMVCMMVFTIASVGIALLQTLDPPILEAQMAAAVDVFIEGIFVIELSARLLVCPSCQTFALDWHNVVDVLAILPLALRAATNFELPEVRNDSMLDLQRNVLLGLVPVLRLLKTMRRLENVRLLIYALETCAEALPICLIPLMVMTLAFGGLIFIVEPRENIGSLGTAMWLTIVTMTTVGYGDTTPQTAAGSCIVSVLVITSVLYMAMPLGIVGQAFQHAWEQRDRVLLLGRTKDRLRQWAYRAEEVQAVFSGFDFDGDGALDEKEFLAMMQDMRLGLPRERALALFRSFDDDGNGLVSDKEFVRALFPASYCRIFGSEADDSCHSQRSLSG